MARGKSKPPMNATVYTCKKCKGQIWLAEGMKKLRCNCGGLLRIR